MQDLDVLAPEPEASFVSGDVLDLIADSVICTDESGRVLLFNAAAERTFGYAADEVIGHPVEILLPVRYRQEHAEHLRNFAAGDSGPDRLMGHNREVWGQRKNGQEFPAEALVSRRTINGETILTVVHRDIGERKLLEEHRETIARELDHRVRNLLSVVNSLVQLTGRDAADVRAFQNSLLGRLRALADTQNALRLGAHQSASVRDLLLGELEHYRTNDRSNIMFEGPNIALPAGPAQSLALVFHELATNSAKYGALSAPGGHVTVTSALHNNDEQKVVSIDWRETGGPTVSPPTREGFGTTLIKRVMGGISGATLDTEFSPDGLICRMALPASAVQVV